MYAFSSSKKRLAGQPGDDTQVLPALVLPSTAWAIFAARVMLNIPILATLITFVAWELMPPQVTDGFASPQRYGHLASSTIFYWWGISVGIACFLASIMLQAYGKRPHFRKEGIEGTEPIFSWDAIFELAIFSVSAFGSSFLPAPSNPWVSGEWTSAFITALVSGVAGAVFISLFSYAIINSMRDALSHREFRAFALKCARQCVGMACLFTLLAAYGSMGIQMHELPIVYARWSGSVFTGDPLNCPSEPAAIAALSALPCTVQPLCGFSTWQEACLRVQLAEASRATGVFMINFPITVLVLWGIYTLYSQGLERDGRAAAKDKEKQSLLRRPTFMRHKQIAPSEHQQQPPSSPSGKARNVEKSGPSYSHLFQPQMFLAFALIVKVVFLQLYFTGRFFALGAFLARPTPHGPGTTPIAPGMCYGACTTYLNLYAWVASGVIVSLICNYDRLRELITRLSSRNAELREQEQELRDLKVELQQQRDADVCNYFFVNRGAHLILDPSASESLRLCPCFFL